MQAVDRSTDIIGANAGDRGSKGRDNAFLSLGIIVMGSHTARLITPGYERVDVADRGNGLLSQGVKDVTEV